MNSPHQQNQEPGRPVPSGSFRARIRPHSRGTGRLRSCSGRHNCERNGYSLLELLIVLALLAMIATLAVPALRNPLDKSRLRSSAQQVQSALAKAKTLAVREGKAVQFRYEVDGNRFRIERVPTQRGSEDLLVDSSFGLGLTATNVGAGDGLLPESDVERDLLREDTLADGVTFGAALSSPTITESFPQSLVETDPVLPESQWSEPIIFFPNGRTQNATILIQGSREFATTIELRGLTAVAAYSAPFRRAPAPDSFGLQPDDSEGSL